MKAGSPTCVFKWGQSMGVRIAKALAERAEIHEGDQVEIQVEGPGIIVVRAVKKARSLDSLLDQITPKNRHSEADWGYPRGNEVW